MPSHRMGRTTEDIRRELTAIFRELKAPYSSAGADQHCSGGGNQ